MGAYNGSGWRIPAQTGLPLVAGKETHVSESASPPAGRRRPSALKRLALAAREIIIVVGALIISALIRAFIGQMFIIPSGSMENTLMVNDRVVALKVADFHRGDIVVFEDPGDWLVQVPQQRGTLGHALEVIGVLPSTATNHLIKRVIGLPGDTITCCDAQGRMSVNGVPLEETAYLFSGNGVTVAPSDFPFTVTVPSDRLFVMGDHRNQSGDSRCHLDDVSNDGSPIGMTAFVPISKVVGPAVLIASPFDRATRLRVPATFADVPDVEGTPPEKPSISAEEVGC